MTIQLDLPPALEQHLRAAAEERHMPLQKYLLFVLEASVRPPEILPAPMAGESEEDFMAAMTRLRRRKGEPALPYTTWPRSEIYRDHD